MSELSEQSRSDVKTEIEKFFTRTLIRLQLRMESVQVKVVSLNKVVRLLQQYSEKKDQQYERQTNNLQLFQGKLMKMEEMEAQMTHYLQRFGEISVGVQNHSLKIEQMQRSMQERQSVAREIEERLAYELQETNRKIERLESGLLQQVREGSKRQEEERSRVMKSGDNYMLQEINFKLTQLQSSHRNDLQKMKNKIDRMQNQLKKPLKQPAIPYGFDHLLQADKGKPSARNKSTSLLKRVKSR